MITRTVRAENMLAALEVIKKDLGPEALVVSVRQVISGPSWQVWKKPLVEVVAIKTDGEAQGEKIPSPEIKINPSRSLESSDKSTENKKQQLLSRVYQLNQQPIEQTATQEPLPEVIPEIVIEPIKPPEPKVNSDFDRILTTLNSLNNDKRRREQVPNKSERIIKTEIASPSELDSSTDFPPVLLRIYQQLLHQGLDNSLLLRLCRTCVDTLPQRFLQDREKIIDCLRPQLEAGLKTTKESIGSIPKLIFLVGTSGVGKTSVCAKLAIHFSMDLGLKVGWVCADTVRIGAISEAHTYTETIGIPLSIAYTPEELVGATMAFAPEMDCVLVDTPAFNSRNETSVVEIGNLLTVLPQRSTWVVSSATAKEADMQNSVAALGPFKPRGLVITKLDETNNFSAAYNLVWRTQLPINYFTFGSRVVNDLEPAKANHLVKALFEERFSL